MEQASQKTVPITVIFFTGFGSVTSERDFARRRATERRMKRTLVVFMVIAVVENAGRSTTSTSSSKKVLNAFGLLFGDGRVRLKILIEHWPVSNDAKENNWTSGFT